jgi:signal transduction histidine kinase
MSERWNVDPYALRLAAVVLSLAGGLGPVLYGLAWLYSTEPLALAQGSRTAPPATHPVIDPALRVQRTFAVGFATLGILVFVRGRWFWPGDAIMVPGTLVAIASALLWYRSNSSVAAVRDRDPMEQVLSGTASPLRTGIGGVLAVIGIGVLASSAGGFDALPRAASAMVVAIAGVAVLVGPYVGRLISQVGDEQRQRIRTEERAAVASHLHDSVLQTLALMQRASDDPRRMVALARRQERELRNWLYGTGAEQAETSLGQRCEALASEVEFDLGVSVELVVVGDIAANDRTDALLGAVREATLNSARHAGVDRVSVYVEVEDQAVFASVRDTGCGFEPMSVPPDRRGVVDSIRGRVSRVGGSADLRTSPDSGTEWELRVPLLERVS